MNLTIIVNPYEHDKIATARAVAMGCVKHGDRFQVVLLEKGVNDTIAIEVEGSDADCCWGWGRGKLQRQAGHNVLIMERPYLGDRSTWVTLGWNGLYGRALFPCVNDGGARWQKYFAQLMQPWRTRHNGYVLVLGEAPIDVEERTVDYESSVNSVVKKLKYLGYDVRFRPHPKARAGQIPAPVIGGTLEDALTGAMFTVNWNSNAGVLAVISGVPTVTLDTSAMAWEVTSHDLTRPIVTPDREAWAHHMAYAQWLPQEIAHGDAWAHLRNIVAGDKTS